MIAKLFIPLSLMTLMFMCDFGHVSGLQRGQRGPSYPRFTIKCSKEQTSVPSNSQVVSNEEYSIFMNEPLKFEGVDYNNPETTHNDTLQLMSSCTGEYLRCLSYSIKITKVCYMDVRDNRMKTASNICDLDLINCDYIRSTNQTKKLSSIMNVALYEGDGSCEQYNILQKNQYYRHEIPPYYKFRTRPPEPINPKRSTTTEMTTIFTTTISTKTKRTRRPWFKKKTTIPTNKTKRTRRPWFKKKTTIPTNTTKRTRRPWFKKKTTIPTNTTKRTRRPWFKKKTKSTTTIPTTTKLLSTNVSTDWCLLSPIGYTYDLETGLCYSISIERATWHEAVGACEADGKGSHLAVIRSEKERSVIGNLISKIQINWNNFQYGYYWIGFWCPTCTYNTTVEQMQFVTIFNEPLPEVGFNRWGINEPNNPNFEHCGCIYGAPEVAAADQALLYNHKCHLGMFYICQRRKE